MKKPIPTEYAEAICAIVARHCGGGPLWSDDLLRTLVNEGVTEFRFQGLLGFGGKFWDNAGRWYVNCYREDETPVRLRVIERANEQLTALRRRYDAGLSVVEDS